MENLSQLVGKTYFVRTFGCQMNMHDSERVAGLLESKGCIAVDHPNFADIVVYMTCCVRENADQKLYGQVSAMVSAPQSPSGKRVVCIGGCIAQRDGETIRKHMKNVDVVFGTQAIGRMPAMVANAFDQKEKALLSDTVEDYSGFSTDLPSKRERKVHAWVPIMTGCNNFCTYCIVPHVRGREVSRPIEDIVRECEALVADGVREITLLGQNVNSYGKNIYGEHCFGKLLREVGKTGIERIRFTSSNPHDLDDDIIAAMAEVDAVMPHLHLAVQSGSDDVLHRMNRKYTSQEYIDLAHKLQENVPGLSLTTDIIVGFPGETEEDFQDTLKLVEAVKFNSAFTFIYSPREGTPAAEWEIGATHEEIQDRFDRLVEAVQENAYIANQRELNTRVEVLVEDVSKKDETILMGHSEKNVTVHFPMPEGYTAQELFGKLVQVDIEEAKTWYLKGQMVGEPR